MIHNKNILKHIHDKILDPYIFIILSKAESAEIYPEIDTGNLEYISIVSRNAEHSHRMFD